MKGFVLRRGKTKTNVCKKCGKDFIAYMIKIRQGGGIFCSTLCYAEYRKDHKLDERQQNVFYQKKNKYGLTKEQYLELFVKQDNKCSICKEEFREELKAMVDHDHLTNKIRGLLCSKCNSGLGMFRDNKDILLSAINYLNK
jgi:hypothetical protein